CLVCAAGARRHIRFEIHVLHETEDGTLAPRRIFVAPTLAREFGRIASEIDGRHADPMETRLLWHVDEQERQRIELLTDGAGADLRVTEAPMRADTVAQ